MPAAPVVAAILNRDPQAAEAAMREHVSGIITALRTMARLEALP